MVIVINVVEVVLLVIIIIEMVVIIVVVVMVDNVGIIMVDVIMSRTNHFIHMLVVNQAMQPVPIGIHHYQLMLILKGKDSIENNFKN
jgi:hypothetical protein